jgi:hypothetical protein
VPDTSTGIRVFDLSRIFDRTPDGDNTQDPNLSTAPDADKVGRIGNTFYSYGYRYLIPQIGTWKQSDTSSKSVACMPATDSPGMRFSYLSVDRTTNPSSPNVVAGEYCSNESKPDSTTGRLATWSLIDLHHADQYAANQHDGHSNLDGSPVSASSGWMLQTNKTQGAVHAGSHWYFVQSHGCEPSDVLTLNRSGSSWTNVNSRKVAAQSEDLYYWRGKNRIYSLTERNPEDGCSQKRMIYSVNLD